MANTIVAISYRPELAPIVATWLVAEFGYPGSRTVEELTALILSPPTGPEESFVLFDQDKPVGTASLAHDDLASRRDLTPWLAGVYVEPAHRGRGYASLLVREVEALAASVPSLWLMDGGVTLRTAWVATSGTGDQQRRRGDSDVPAFDRLIRSRPPSTGGATPTVVPPSSTHNDAIAAAAPLVTHPSPLASVIPFPPLSSFRNYLPNRLVADDRLFPALQSRGRDGR
jgi:GNAT superfamily N-acetyltransferase